MAVSELLSGVRTRRLLASKVAVTVDNDFGGIVALKPSSRRSVLAPACRRAAATLDRLEQFNPAKPRRVGDFTATLAPEASPKENLLPVQA